MTANIFDTPQIRAELDRIVEENLDRMFTTVLGPAWKDWLNEEVAFVRWLNE